MAKRDRQDVAALIVRLERASVAYSVEKNNGLNESLHALFERAPGVYFPHQNSNGSKSGCVGTNRHTPTAHR